MFPIEAVIVVITLALASLVRFSFSRMEGTYHYLCV